MEYVLETKDSLSDRIKGPIDPKTGWPTYHPCLVTTASSEEEAILYFESKFPNNHVSFIFFYACQ